MSEDFDKLKKIGIQKIHEKTHIARKHIEAIINENFEGMGNVQLLGFLSIFEREYNLDLREVKERVREYFKTQRSDEQSVKEVKIFATSQKKRNFTIFYILMGVAVVLALLYFASRAPKSEIIEVQEEPVPVVTLIADESNNSLQESNATKENPIESIDVEEEKKPEPVAKPLTLKIVPKTKVWIGYIDLADYKKYQTTLSDALELNATKNWLLSFGHGHINIEINGETNEFKDPTTVRFSYIDSELKKIELEEFKKLNKGSGW